MTIRISSMLPLFNFERLDILRDSIKLCDKKLHVPFWKDVPAKNVVSIAVPGILRGESVSIIVRLGPGSCDFPFPRSHLHKRNTETKLKQVLFEMTS